MNTYDSFDEASREAASLFGDIHRVTDRLSWTFTDQAAPLLAAVLSLIESSSTISGRVANLTPFNIRLACLAGEVAVIMAITTEQQRTEMLKLEHLKDDAVAYARASETIIQRPEFPAITAVSWMLCSPDPQPSNAVSWMVRDPGQPSINDALRERVDYVHTQLLVAVQCFAARQDAVTFMNRASNGLIRILQQKDDKPELDQEAYLRWANLDKNVLALFVPAVHGSLIQNCFLQHSATLADKLRAVQAAASDLKQRIGTNRDLEYILFHTTIRLESPEGRLLDEYLECFHKN